MSQTSNTIRNALKPGYGTVMARKVLHRLERADADAAAEWSHQHAVTTDSVCRAIDAALWAEATDWIRQFEPDAKNLLRTLDAKVTGPGNAQLLYFLTRWRQPDHAVETGVAMGWSSAAILAAMYVNGHGTLWSSDFPYFRLRDPEYIVGVVVPEEHRGRWRLHLRGDRRNLPTIMAQAGPVGLFHYDSDKSVAGRRYGLAAVAAKLTDDAPVVFDDIHNNHHFRNLIAEREDGIVLDGHVGMLLPTQVRHGG